jgi:hypothetical protein
MAKLAIDIVLIPPEETLDLLIEINRKEVEKGNAKSLMGKTDFIPHLSLCMGCIDKNYLPQLFDVVKKIATKFPPLIIELFEIYYGLDSKGEKSYAFIARKENQLQRLHEELMASLEPHLSYEAAIGMHYTNKDEKLDRVPKGISKFKDSNRESFNPHISMLTRNIDYGDLPIKFVASRLAVCHLGVSTTCRRILFEEKLHKD